MDQMKTEETTTTEVLSVIREEQGSPTATSQRMLSSKITAEDLRKDLLRCTCKKEDVNVKLIIFYIILYNHKK